MIAALLLYFLLHFLALFFAFYWAGSRQVDKMHILHMLFPVGNDSRLEQSPERINVKAARNQDRTTLVSVNLLSSIGHCRFHVLP